LWFVAYWSAFCFVLAVLTGLLWPRGVPAPGWRGALAAWRMALRTSGLSSRLALGAGGLATATLAGWIFYNTTVLNPYQPPGKELLAVNHEKRFKQYEHLPMPVVVDTRLKVDLYPSRRHFLATGSYTLENRTDQPIHEIHLSTFINLKLVRAGMAGARLAEAHPEWGYYIYRLDAPMQPGARAELEFVTRTDAPRGFRNQVDSDDVYMVSPNEALQNGTSLYSPFILPFIGYTKMVEHKEAWLRDKHGLPPLDSRMRPHDDPVGLARALTVSHLAWGASDVLIGTDGDQTPVSSGLEKARWQADGRNYAHYASEAPHRGKFTVYSARYATLDEDSARVPVRLYYHPDHAANARPMARHLARALDFYEAAFGPYPYSEARLVEFAYYPGMVFSESGTIGLPEVLAWKAELAGDGEDAMIGWLTYLLAHAWWEDQLIVGDVAGSMTVREALSGYASNLYRRATYAPERFLAVKQRQMRDFFRALGKADFEEPPLEDVYNEVLIARFKGQMVLELIESRIGQPALLAAIRDFLTAHAGRPAPYATVLDLRDAIQARTPPALRAWVEDVFAQVVTYRYALLNAGYRPGEAGNYQVELEVEAGTLHSRGLGEQQTGTLDVPLEVRVLDAAGHPLYQGPLTMTGPRTRFTLALKARPHRVILDPALTLPTALFAGRERVLGPL